MSIAIHNATLYSFITEQFEREAAALRVQEAETSKLNAVLGSITDGVVVFDAGRRVILANAAAERLFGVAADYLIGTRDAVRVAEPRCPPRCAGYDEQAHAAARFARPAASVAGPLPHRRARH